MFTVPPMICHARFFTTPGFGIVKRALHQEPIDAGIVNGTGAGATATGAGLGLVSAEGEAVGEGDADGVAAALTVGLGLAEGVAVGLEVGLGVGLDVGLDVGLGEGVGSSADAGAIARVPMSSAVDTVSAVTRAPCFTYRSSPEGSESGQIDPLLPLMHVRQAVDPPRCHPL